MIKIFKYNKKSILLHTIFLIVLIAILSSQTLFVEGKTRIVFSIIYSIIIGLYAIYVIAGYIIMISNYLSYRKGKGSLILQLKTDNVYRVIITNSFSAAYALLFAIFNHIFLYTQKNVFYLMIEEIYLSIGLIKIFLVFNAEKPMPKFKNSERLISLFLFILSFGVLSCAILVKLGNGTFTKNEIMIYAYALYAFYSLISAIISFTKAYKTRNLARARFFMVKFGVACFSMFVLEVSLLNQFSKDIDIAKNYEFIIGLILAALIFTESIFLAIKVTVQS